MFYKFKKIIIKYKIKKILRKHPVHFAYLFGSYAKNQVGLLSDLDLAVYLDSRVTKDEQNKIISDLRDNIEKSLGLADKVDIILLNQELPPLLLREIVYDGSLIYSKDELKRMYWESMAISLWLDWEYYQRQYSNAILAQGA